MKKYHLIFPLIIIVDQISKYFVVKNLEYSINSGLILGIGSNEGVFALIFNLLMLLVLLGLFLTSQRDRNLSIILISILGAGCSNFIDRILRGGVVDFINIGNFPSFNIADSVITIGIIMLIVYIMIDEYKKIQSRKG